MARSRLFASLIIFVLFALPVFAGDQTTGTLGSAYLKLGSGVRAPSMGGAFTAIADDGTAIFWNPAGIANISTSEISANYSVWLLDTNYSNIQYVLPFKAGTMGASIFYLNYGNISETTSTQRLGTGNTFNPSAYVVSLAWGQKFNEALSFGASLKTFNQNINSYSEGGVALDAGVCYLSRPLDAKIAGVVQNLGGSLPQTFKIGASKALLQDRLNVDLDINMPNDNKAYLSCGGEFKIVPQFVIRAGFNTKSEENAGGNLGVGLGLNLSRFSVDYGYVPYGDLGSAHRVGIRVGL